MSLNLLEKMRVQNFNVKIRCSENNDANWLSISVGFILIKYKSFENLKDEKEVR